MTKTLEITTGLNTSGCSVFNAEEADYTPFNKRDGEVKAHGKLRFTYYDGSKKNPDAWLSIYATEQVQDKNGSWRQKVISFHLHGADQIAQLRGALNMPTGEVDNSRPLGVL